MKQIMALLGILMFPMLLASLSTADIDFDADSPHTVKLLATLGDNPDLIPIGEVRIWEDPENLYVKYAITNADWSLKSTHLFVSSRYQDFAPVTDSPPLIRFELQQAHRGEKEYTYKIPCTWQSGTKFRIAAKAEVFAVQGYTSDIQGLIDSLPAVVQVNSNATCPGDPAYLQVMIAECEDLDGFHEGWCVDIDRPRVRRWYNAEVYTPFDEMPPGIMEFPENLDLVNWIISKDFVGKPALPCGVYTFGDIQHAVWMLLEGRSTNYSKGPWNEARATGIIEAAKAEGEGFIPGYNDKFLLILVPVNKNGKIHWQSMGIGIPTPCLPVYTIETAWGLAWNVSWYSIGPRLTFSIR